MTIIISDKFEQKQEIFTKINEVYSRKYNIYNK